MLSSAEPIGLSSTTDEDPSTSSEFALWLKPDVVVNPFDIVEVEHLGKDGSKSRSRTFGIVLGLEHRTDAPSHLTNFISNDFGGQVSGEPNTQRVGATIARCAVLNNSENIYMAVGNERPVRFADESGIHLALGISDMPPERRIPAGVIVMSNGAQTPVYIDRDYLLGPQAAHVNIAGISGLATKTSYAMFLMQSIIQSTDASKTAFVLFNLKHDDLLRIDQAADELNEEDRDLWSSLGLEPQPFSNVHYFLPEGKDTTRTSRPNSYAIPKSFQTYAYALRDIYDRLDLLFANVTDKEDTIDSLVGLIADGIQSGNHKWESATTWRALLDNEPLVRDGKAQAQGDIRPASVGKFRRQLRRIVLTRSSGLFVETRRRGVVSLNQEVQRLKGGHTYVFDIARLMEEEQSLVFGDVLRTIYELYAEAVAGEGDLPERVILFVDELNKYAPAFGANSPILRYVLDVAERGRSLGVVLFSAEQFASAAHSRVVGNAATQVYGRTGMTELAKLATAGLDEQARLNLTRLVQGELVLNHATYRQSVKIRFPRPAYKQER